MRLASVGPLVWDRRALNRSTPHVLFSAYHLLTVVVMGQSTELLPEMTVLAERLGGMETTATWERAAIREAAPRTIDEMLAGEPSFSLYRRQSAMFGNPTSAGVSLRNTGATAASRTLVLLDGVPQNDPFGGWVYWARYNAAALESIRITPAARAVVWGSQSPAGVIQMNRRPVFENIHAIKAGAGGQGTYAGSMMHQIADADGGKSFSFSAFGLHSDGFYALDSSQRGPIDRKLDIDLWGADAGFAWQPAPGLTIEPRVSWYAEERGNGTPLARNSTDALDLSLRLTAEQPDYSWQLTGWHQRREFDSVFSSVNAARTAETLALDQYDVPGRGTGGSLVFQWDGADRWSFMAGADTRFISGETNETVGTFRDREAGGKQDFAGIFGSAEFQADPSTTLNMAARLDAWWLRDGRRIETSLTNGAVLRSDDQPDRDGIEPSASLELTRQLGADVEARLAAGTGFRAPTLNELHRPFRVRNDIVEANPALDPERFINLEAGIEWQPAENLGIGLAFFHHWIRDAIANVPVTDPAEISAIIGAVPPGGSLAQRRNVDEARVMGIEANVEWRPAEDITFDITGLWSETRFSESRAQPLLEGQPFPQAPDLRLVAGGEWRPRDDLSFFADIEYGASQYDDALAARRIPDYTSARIGAIWRHGRGIYQIRVDNLFDEEIQTGLASNGLRTYGAPRSLWLGAEWEF
jgi:outer membrane receptor protein involved in Fe transport